MNKKKIFDGFSGKQTGFSGVYDTEVRCATCSTKLYVSPEGASLILDSLRRTGVAGLLCLCGHMQFINARLQPIVPINRKVRND